MKAKLLQLKSNARHYFEMCLIGIVGLIVASALTFQVTMISLEMAGKTEITRAVGNWFSWHFDGRFKNSPENILYKAEDHIWVESVTNEVKIGKLAGNRKLEFGVKNILEEYLQERGLDLSSDATQRLKVSIIYLDVLTTKKNISIFHSGEEEVVIRLRGTLYKDGKKDKEVIVEESSSEISMSTLIVDEGGKFNQTSLSNALKKASDKLITKLLGEKK
jgi:hypothetical protein